MVVENLRTEPKTFRMMHPQSKSYQAAMRGFLASMRRRYESVGTGGNEIANEAIKLLNSDLPNNTFITHDAFRVVDSGVTAQLCVVEYLGQVLEGRYNSLGHHRPCYSQLVLLELPQQVERIWIRPESIRDRITEFFKPREIDLPRQRDFSSRYYLLANEPDDVQQRLPGHFWSAVGRHGGLIVKAYKHHMFVATDRELAISAMESLLTAGMDIAFSLSPKCYGDPFKPAREQRESPVGAPFCYHCGETVGRNQKICPACRQPID